MQQMSIKNLKQSTLTFGTLRKREIQPSVQQNPSVKELSFEGYEVINTPEDGDCLFSALSHQLSIGTDRQPAPAEYIRRQLVDYVRTHPSLTDDIKSSGESRG